MSTTNLAAKERKVLKGLIVPCALGALSWLSVHPALAQEPVNLLRPPTVAPANAPALSPLLLPDRDGINTIRSTNAWNARRETLKREWAGILGEFPKQKPAFRAEVLETEEFPEMTRQHVRYQVEEGVFTDGYLLAPRGRQGRRPGVVVFHQTVRTHAQQPAGVDASNPELTTGVQLVKRGYVVLCPRCFIFDDGTNYLGNVSLMQKRHPAWTGMARMTWDGIRAADFLEAQPNVDKSRLGAIGHSLGAKEVLYAAAFDGRYQVAVFSEGGIGMGFSNWEAPWYLGPQIKKAEFKRDHHELIALIAPRAFLLLAGESADGDRSWPFIAAARPIYGMLGASDNLGWLNHRAGHRYPPNAQEIAGEFLDRHLKP